MSPATKHDSTGKASFDDIYAAPDPRGYYTSLREYEYGIPERARPHFTGLIDEYRRATGVIEPQVLDIGCSYGVNAALLRFDTTLAELNERYGPAVADHTREQLLAADRQFTRTGPRRITARLTGLDTSGPALAYALEAGFLDDAVRADLESSDPTPHQREQLGKTDVVLSTGCIGYVTEKTLRRVVEAAEDRPWQAHFCLRMFPFAPIAAALDDLGYDTETVGPPTRQRRFASRQEEENVLDRLAGLGLDPAGLEADGWFYAQLFVSRPRKAARP